jgi:predicted DNA-binding protein
MTPSGRPEIGPPIQIRLSEETIAALDALAARKDVSRSEVIRQLLEVGIKRHRELMEDVDFAVHVATRLNQIGITAAEFARRTGVGNSTISRWLSGASRPDSRTRRKVDEALDAIADS